MISLTVRLRQRRTVARNIEYGTASGRLSAHDETVADLIGTVSLDPVAAVAGRRQALDFDS